MLKDVARCLTMEANWGVFTANEQTSLAKVVLLGKAVGHSIGPYNGALGGGSERRYYRLGKSNSRRISHMSGACAIATQDLHT